jgi:decaprenylphosphoryl-5-phosphoribose phosphatase
MSGETWMVRAVQRWTLGPRTLPAATLLDRAGEHAAAWIAAGLVGAAVDVRGRQRWVQAVVTVLASHGSSVVLKRVVRRVRPAHPSLGAHVAVPSRWSFPSSHAASTTTAAILYGRLLGTRLTAVLPVAMAWSRLGLGVHYPSDVASGIALGSAVAALAPIGHRRGAR